VRVVLIANLEGDIEVVNSEQQDKPDVSLYYEVRNYLSSDDIVNFSSLRKEIKWQN